ncbi:MAG: RNA polymerase-binding protein DksA [Polaromonas sp.]|uniref:RNA polymerase-binding protein DksA n=1 Tax=Polaromonas sp. TaxID=1869339 RepID=UPI00326628FB
MKAQAKKTKAPAKPATKSVPKAKAAAKAVKKPAKPVAKAKPALKPAAKKAAKPAVKAAPAKKPAPAAVKKTAAKPLPKAKAVAKPAKPVLKSPPKTAAKPVAKSAAKPVAKPAVKPVAKAAVVAKPVQPVVVAAPAPAPVRAGLIAPPPLKPGRRSSARVATQSPPPAPMVPTHAPDAAKASYSTMTERVIAPPPQAAAKKDPKLANNWKTKSAEQLTDDEVKAMPDSEYMNEKQLAFFRHKLSVLKQDIHNSAGETTEHLREDTVVVPDPADRATIEEEHALELRTRDRERKLLKKIEQSIARIDSGDYGYCDETGEPIGVGRLIARPTANLSLEAQQRRELKQKMFGD